MDVIVSRQQSTLNPNAPMFVPQSYRTVEDFSPEWWALVHSSPWFRDYWLQLNFNDPQHDPFVSDDPLFPDEYDLIDDLFDEYPIQVEKKKDLVSMGMLKGKKDRCAAKAPRFVEKAPKIVNVKMSPRPIQQPR